MLLGLASTVILSVKPRQGPRTRGMIAGPAHLIVGAEQDFSLTCSVLETIKMNQHWNSDSPSLLTVSVATLPAKRTELRTAQKRQPTSSAPVATETGSGTCRT
jgi:hypothetical protein